SLEAVAGRTGAVQHRAGTRVVEEVIIRTLESAPKGADGISCEVVVPAMVPSRAGDGVKTDPGCGLAGGGDWHRDGGAEVYRNRSRNRFPHRDVTSRLSEPSPEAALSRPAGSPGPRWCPCAPEPLPGTACPRPTEGARA